MVITFRNIFMLSGIEWKIIKVSTLNYNHGEKEGLDWLLMVRWIGCWISSSAVTKMNLLYLNETDPGETRIGLFLTR